MPIQMGIMEHEEGWPSEMSFQTRQNYPLVILCSINPCIMIPRVEYCESKVLTLKSWSSLGYLFIFYLSIYLFFVRRPRHYLSCLHHGTTHHGTTHHGTTRHTPWHHTPYVIHQPPWHHTPYVITSTTMAPHTIRHNTNHHGTTHHGTTHHTS